MDFLINPTVKWNIAKDYVQASKVSKLVYVINDISNLVHETQVERGMSSGFLGSGGILYKEELKLQRTKS